MRVAIIGSPFIPVPPKKYGGTEQIIDNLIRGLLEEGHEPILLGTGDSKVDCELIPMVDKAIYFPKSKKNVPAHEKLVQKIYKEAEKQLRRLMPRVDIIHSHGFDLRKFSYFPNVTTIHGPILLEDFPYYGERKNLNYVTISKNQQEAYPALNYVGVVYNGLNPDKFPFVEKPDNYICFLGRFDREKNPHLAIQLAINLGVRIKLAGKLDHSGEGYFDEEIKPYLKHPLVEYLGELNFNQKVELLSNAKCNIHPTGFREPFGVVVLEAAYCGTPTLAIERGSMPELIEEERTGMLVEDFVEGYHQIERCFQMDRNYISQRAKSLFNYKNMSKQYIGVYEHVAESFKPRWPILGKLQRFLPKSIGY